MSWWHGDQVTGMWILWTLAAVLVVLASWITARALNAACTPESQDDSSDLRLALGNGPREE